MKAATGHIWDVIRAGDFTGPERKPMGRVTVDQHWRLNLGFGPIGAYPANRLPVRWWASTTAAWKNETEVPNVKSIKCDWSLDQDAATATIVFYNTLMDPITSGGLVGNPGALTPDRGKVSNRWGHTTNVWQDAIVEGALLRSYQGFGGFNADGSMKSIAACLAGGYIVQTGTWMIDDVRITSDGLITCICRDMMALLIDQPFFPPLVPSTWYPGDYRRYGQQVYDTPRVDYGSHVGGVKNIVGCAASPTVTDATGHDNEGYWLCGDDGGVFALGTAHFYGANVSQPSKIVGMAANPSRNGYWLGLADGQLLAFGGAVDFSEFIIDQMLPGPDPRSPYVAITAPRPPPTSFGVNGLYMVTSVGEIGHAGSATFYGGIPTTPAPIVGIASRPLADGYWLVNRDGQVYCQPVGTKVCVPIVRRAKHGTNSGYSKGCRCEQCRDARRRYNRDYSAGRRTEEPATTTVQYEQVPIEQVVVGDLVTSYEIGTRRFHREGSRVTRTERRSFNGELIRVTLATGESSRYTPDHHCVVMLGDAYKDQQVVYLMRRGNQYRIGRCQWRLPSQKNTSGVVRRCSDEGGDACWILSAHDEKCDAALAEAMASQKFGIPTWTFVSKIRTKGSAHAGRLQHLMDLDVFWASVGDNSERAEACLAEHSLTLDEPLWTTGEGDNHLFRRPLVLAACHLTSGMRMLALSNARSLTRTLTGQSGAWVAIEVETERYKGDIVSLSVDRDHTYIADGVVTHNSYGSAPYLGNTPNDTGHPTVAIVASNSGNGYIIVDDAGHVYSFGDAPYAGGTGGIALTDPISSIMLTPDGAGYWLVAKDGGVFAFGSAIFYGSLVKSTTFDVVTDGTYTDFSTIIQDLVLWSGFWLHNTTDDSGMPAVYGSIESTGSFATDVIPADLFDKQSIIDCVTKVKEVVGFIVGVKEDGSFYLNSPNWWGPGNFLPDGSHTAFIPVIDEKWDLIAYGVQRSQRSDRTNIIISTDDPTANLSNTVTTNLVLPSNGFDRGMFKPTMLFNPLFNSALDQEIMAELIALHILFQRRLGSVTCVANPLVDVDDQLQIFEEQSEEMWTHHVRGISTEQDLDEGSYIATYTTAWLGDATSWTIVRPDGIVDVP